MNKNIQALSIGLLCVTPASAQSISGQPSSIQAPFLQAGSVDATPNQEVFTFNEVVVSATRSEQNIEDVAASIDLVTRAGMDEKLAQDLKQAVAAEPGVSMSGSGRYGNAGFTIRGLSENYVKTLVDGVELPASYNPGADVMRKFNNNIETDTLERIEINKGPSSSLYGSDALAGAVIIRTKTPDDLLKKEGDDTYSSLKGGYYSADKSYKATATLANRTADFSSLLIFTHRSGHEMQTHGSGANIEGRDRGQSDPFDIQSDNFLGKIFYQLNENHQIGLTGEVFHRDGEGLILSNEGYAIMPGFVYTRNSAKDEDQRQRLTFEHQWKGSNQMFDTLKWQVTGLITTSKHQTFDETKSKGYRNRERVGSDESVQMDVQFNKFFEFDTSYHEINYGVHLVRNEFDLSYRDIFLEGANAGTQTQNAAEVPNASAFKWGLFLQDQAFFLEDTLVVNGGLRYDSVKAKPENITSKTTAASSHAVTGKWGMVYHLSESVSGFANISQGFKSPSLQDLYFFYETDAQNGAIFEANPKLKPEKSLGYEMGLHLQNDVGRLDFAVFFNDYSDFITERKITNKGPNGKEIWTKENINKAQIYGAEMSVKWGWDVLLSAPRGVYSEMSVAYAKGENKDNGQDIESVAPLTGLFSLGYKNSTFGGVMSLKAVDRKTGIWEGDLENGAENIPTPGYSTLDFTGFYSPTPQLTFRAGLFNALDKKYWDYNNLSKISQDALGIDRRAEAGRNWGLEAEYVF